MDSAGKGKMVWRRVRWCRSCEQEGVNEAPVIIEHVHLSNNRLKLAARGRLTPESRYRARAAA